MYRAEGYSLEQLPGDGYLSNITASHVIHVSAPGNIYLQLSRRDTKLLLWDIGRLLSIAVLAKMLSM